MLKNKNYVCQFNCGISIISLVISIIVIIILAAIVIFTGLGTPDKARFAQFTSDISGIQEAVQQKYAQRYTELSTENANFNNRDIYRWIAVGNSVNTTLGLQSVSSFDGSKLFGATLPSTDKNGNEIIWYVKTLSDTEKKVIEIDEVNNKLGIKLPKYEGSVWKIRLSDGLIILDPPYEYEGKKYASIEDINNGGGMYASTQSNANVPLIRSGMIPVYYDESAKIWKKANIDNDNNQWFDYSNKKWANAVTVSDGKYNNAAVGTPILEEDILGYWVWIPRFAYKLNADTKTVDVVFLEEDGKMFGSQIAGEGNEYVVHPAFESNPELGGWDRPLKGFWASKFEASDSDAGQIEDVTGRYITQVVDPGTVVNVTVIGEGVGTVNDKISTYGGNSGFPVFKPNANGMRLPSMSTWMYSESIDIKNTHNANVENSHLMKNSEWGAIAYLSKSQYGNNNINSNSYFEGEFSNTGSNYLTSLTGVCEQESAANSMSYEKIEKIYNNNDDTITIKYKDTTNGNEITKTFYRYNTAIGGKGSTTGNVYGIFDMVGGNADYVAAYIDNGHKNSWNVASYDERCITKYKVNSTDSSANNLEENKNIYGDGVYEVKGWVKNGTYPNNSLPWFSRGNSNTGIGDILYYTHSYGYSMSMGSFHAVLIP